MQYNGTQSKRAFEHQKRTQKKPRKDTGQTEQLVAFYDIRPGNGSGLFFQSWSPHGACAPEPCRAGRLMTIYGTFISSRQLRIPVTCQPN